MQYEYTIRWQRSNGRGYQLSDEPGSLHVRLCNACVRSFTVIGVCHTPGVKLITRETCVHRPSASLNGLRIMNKILRTLYMDISFE